MNDPAVKRVRERSTASGDASVTEDQAYIEVELADGRKLTKFIEASSSREALTARVRDKNSHQIVIDRFRELTSANFRDPPVKEQCVLWESG